MSVRSLTIERSDPRVNPGIVALVVAMTIWGATYVVTKSALVAFGPFSIIMLRFLIAGAVMLPFAIRRGYRFRQSFERRFLVFGFTGMLLHLGLENLGLVYTSAAGASLIIATAPAVTAGLAAVLLRERLARKQVAGVLVSVMGAALVTQASAGGGGTAPALGNLLVFGGVVAWGVFTVQGKRLADGYPAIVSTTAATVAAAMLSIPAVAIELAVKGAPPVTPGAAAAVLYLGLFASAGAYGLWNFSLRHVGASVAGSFVNLVPVIGVILAVAVGESMTPRQWVGGAVVGVGIWLTGRRRATPVDSDGMGVVEEIYIAERGSAPMRRVDEIEAVQGAGLRGDRYMERTGYWSGVDECQVTLIEAESLAEIASSTDVHVTNGEHRRNIITRDVRLTKLSGKRFRIGDVVLEYDRPRPPCRYIQSLTQRGMTKALGRGRGGICARVVESGVIRPGDPIEVV